jgi:DNA invertase Pin-like site-specific DNA recombinase
VSRCPQAQHLAVAARKRGHQDENCIGIRERQREGIAIAKREGVYKGRKPSLSPDRAEELRSRLAAGKVNKANVAREFGISRAALYVYAGRA